MYNIDPSSNSVWSGNMVTKKNNQKYIFNIKNKNLWASFRISGKWTSTIITDAIKKRRLRWAGHAWRSQNEFIKAVMGQNPYGK